MEALRVVPSFFLNEQHVKSKKERILRGVQNLVAVGPNCTGFKKKLIIRFQVPFLKRGKDEGGPTGKYLRDSIFIVSKTKNHETGTEKMTREINYINRSQAYKQLPAIHDNVDWRTFAWVATMSGKQAYKHSKS